MVSGLLGAVAAKVSTGCLKPNASDSETKVICVYTTQEDMDEVGLKLIWIVKETIRYKTNMATRQASIEYVAIRRPLKWNSRDPIISD